MAKRYLQIKWIHSNPDEPVEIYYELGNDHWASRGIEFFADGTSTSVTYGLKEASIPPLEQINLDPQLQGIEVTEGEFEAAWFELISC